MYFNATRDDFPALKGRAAEMRHFPAALSHVFAKHMNAANPMHELVKNGLDICESMERILDAHKDAYRLPEPDATNFSRYCFAYGQICVRLRRHYRHQTPPIHLFKFIPKIHLICHIGLYARFLNPRLGWCYGPEAFMKVVKRCVVSCSAGSPAQLVCCKAMSKYCYALGLDLENSG